MAKAKFPRRKKLTRILTGIFLVPLFIYGIYTLYYLKLIYPEVYVAGINVSGKTQEEGAAFLSQKVAIPPKIIVVNGSQQFEIETSELNFSHDFAKSASEAFLLDRKGALLENIRSRLAAPFVKRHLDLSVNIGEAELNNFIFAIAGQIDEEASAPSIKLISGKIIVDKGKVGHEVETAKLRSDIVNALASAKSEPTIVSIKTIDPTIDDDEAGIYQRRGEQFIGKAMNFTFEFQEFPYKTQALLRHLAPKGGYDSEEINRLAENLANLVDREPQNPTFAFLPAQAGEGGRVKEFAPAKDGIKTKQEELKEKVLSALGELEKGETKAATLEIPVERTGPEVKTGDVNDLGIKELIGRGTSRFRGSIPSRVHNIVLASSRISGVLIKPGEIFSFNNALGDVSKFTGYKEAYIIQDGKTILGDGGGVCQVSSTLFRAVLNAGLPIVERRAHAYRVGYYEQDSPPGFDATVYSPTTDLKIKNDTENHILIQATVNTKTSTLVFELYGTADGRVAKTTKPAVSDVVPPPEDRYDDDPTLPIGQVKQIDYKAAGAKVVFTYTVTKEGEITYQKKFTSLYRPWQAVYLRGTAPVQ